MSRSRINTLSMKKWTNKVSQFSNLMTKYNGKQLCQLQCENANQVGETKFKIGRSWAIYQCPKLIGTMAYLLNEKVFYRASACDNPTQESLLSGGNESLLLYIKKQNEKKKVFDLMDEPLPQAKIKYHQRVHVICKFFSLEKKHSLSFRQEHNFIKPGASVNKSGQSEVTQLHTKNTK